VTVVNLCRMDGIPRLPHARPGTVVDDRAEVTVRGIASLRNDLGELVAAGGEGLRFDPPPFLHADRGVSGDRTLQRGPELLFAHRTKSDHAPRRAGGVKKPRGAVRAPPGGRGS
jgi:hypothetical protein